MTAVDDLAVGSAVPSQAGPARAGHGSRTLAINAAAGGAANGVKILVQLVMLPLMAHLLGPAEFGLYALALPTIALFTSLADGGLGTSLAREKDDDPVVWSTAFWMLLLSGLVLACIVASWGVVLSILSHEPRLKGIMGLLSLSLVLISISILPSARLTRQGRLVIFAAADVSSNVIGAGLAVVLAARGEGAWSLASQYIAGFVIRATILNAAAFYRPGYHWQPSMLRGHLSTGSAVLGTRMVEFCGRLLENLFYQRAFGAAGLGTYTFANQAPRFICEAASNPIWGALYAHALREEPEQIARLHRRIVHLLATAVFPVAFLISMTSHELLNLLLGPKWSATADLLQILVPFYALYVVASQSGAILVAQGRSWVLFWCTVVLASGRVLSVWAGFLSGPVTVACAIGACYIVFAVLMLRAPARVMSVGPAWFRLLATPLLSSIAAGFVCHVLLQLRAPDLFWTLFSLAGGGVFYAAMALLLDGQRLLPEIRTMRRVVLKR